jgi:hypothetical protein
MLRHNMRSNVNKECYTYTVCVMWLASWNVVSSVNQIQFHVQHFVKATNIIAFKINVAIVNVFVIIVDKKWYFVLSWEC